MKTTILKIGFLLLFLSFLGAACKNVKETYWEIAPNSQSTIIQKDVAGIEFKFCLLNEQGVTATVFNEGEKFSFFFSVTNKSREKLYFDPGFAYNSDIKFCNIYNSENHDLGKPYILKTALDVGAGAYPFDFGKTYVFQQNWVDNRETNWDWENGVYESTHRTLLKRGDYYTGFKYRFQFSGEPSFSTDTLSFKINFKIK